MSKHLLKKWAILLLLGSALLSSCIDKDYDWDTFDGDEWALKGMAFGAPLGTIEYDVKRIVEKASNQHLIIDGDTIFLIYDADLEFGDGQGDAKKIVNIDFFEEVTKTGSQVFFTNPIFDCTVENNGTEAKFSIDYVTGQKDNAKDIQASFGVSKEPNVDINVPTGGSTRRFDRDFGATNEIFRLIDTITNEVGPDRVEYAYKRPPGRDDITAKINLRLPMAFDAGSRLVFNDTLSLDLSAYTEESENIEMLVIRVHYTWKLPVGDPSSITCTFLDKDNSYLTAIPERKITLDKAKITQIAMPGLANFYPTNITEQASTGIIYVKFEKSEFEAVKNIGAMKFKTVITNPDENIYFLPSDYLQLKVDLYVKGNIKL